MDVIDSKLSELNEWKGARQFTITKTNGNTYGAYPYGISVSFINGENRAQNSQFDNTNFPVNGTILTVNHNRYRCYQTFHISEGNNAQWYRHYYKDAWSAWKKIIDEDDAKEYPRTRRVSSAVLNNNTTMESGMFVVNSGSTIGLPIQDWYHVINLKHYNEDGYNAQIALRLSSGEGIFFRNSCGGTWRPWRRLDSSDVYKASSFTIDMSMQNCFVRIGGKNDCTITVPHYNDVPLPVGIDITFFVETSKQVTLVPASNVVIWSENNSLKSDGQCTAFTLRTISSNFQGKTYWAAIGRLTP
jgi:hypothetical protein